VYINPFFNKTFYDGIINSKNWISDETETMFEVLEEETEGKAYTSALGSFSSRGADHSFLESFEFEFAAKADQLFTNLKMEERNGKSGSWSHTIGE